MSEKLMNNKQIQHDFKEFTKKMHISFKNEKKMKIKKVK